MSASPDRRASMIENELPFERTRANYFMAIARDARLRVDRTSGLLPSSLEHSL
jgi:hypothetical protein